MKFLVLGAGRLGYAVIYDLIRSSPIEKVVVADRDVARVESLERELSDGKIVPVELDFHDSDYVSELMRSSDVTLSCAPSELNYELAKTSLHAESHFCSIGGSAEHVKMQFRLDELAREQNVTIIPELGLVPGLVSILVKATVGMLDELYEIRIRVGDLPVERGNSVVKFSHIYSASGVLDSYLDSCTIIRDGSTYQVPSLTDIEEIEFPKPIGKLEAFNIAGGVSSMVRSLRGRVKHLDHKMIQYPGHCERIALIRDLGLLQEEKVTLPSGEAVSPREVLLTQLSGKMPERCPDMVILRVTVTGMKDKKPLQCVWNGIDYGDEARKISAASRMTAFPASIIAQMVARGDIKERGVLRQEEVVPTRLFLAEIAGRGVSLTMTERTPIHESV